MTSTQCLSLLLRALALSLLLAIGWVYVASIHRLLIGSSVQQRQEQAPGLSLMPRDFASAVIDEYTTSLTPEEEQQFLLWKRKYAPYDSGADYDLRGAFKAGITPDPETGHWVDTYKKPNHPTFSVESIYAKLAPGKAGRWDGDVFVSPQRRELEDLEYNPLAVTLAAEGPYFSTPKVVRSKYGKADTSKEYVTIGHGHLVDDPVAYLEQAKRLGIKDPYRLTKTDAARLFEDDYYNKRAELEGMFPNADTTLKEIMSTVGYQYSPTGFRSRYGEALTSGNISALQEALGVAGEQAAAKGFLGNKKRWDKVSNVLERLKKLREST